MMRVVCAECGAEDPHRGHYRECPLAYCQRHETELVDCGCEVAA